MTRYERATEATPSRYILISEWEEVGADKKGGDGGSVNGGGCSGRAIVDQRTNLESFMMNGKLTESRAELAAEKAVSNRGSGGQK